MLNGWNYSGLKKKSRQLYDRMDPNYIRWLQQANAPALASRTVHENVPASVNNVLKSRRRRLSVARDRRGCREQQADGRGDRRRRSPPGTNPRSVKVSAGGSGDAHGGVSESF